MSRYFICEGTDGVWLLLDTDADGQGAWSVLDNGTENSMSLRLAALERPTLANAPMGPPIALTFVQEGQRSRDGRTVKMGATTWNADALPLPFLYQRINGEGHRGGVVVGRIDTIDRNDAGLVTGRGFLGTQPDAQEAEMMIRSGQQHFISIDGGEAAYEEVPGIGDDDDPLGGLFGPTGDLMFTQLEIAAATMVPIPAFACAQVEIDDTATPGGVTIPPIAAAAGAGPAPRMWFGNPALREPTPLTVTDDGRIFGHVAIWGVCHTGYPGQCVEAPRSRTKYAYFLKPNGYVTAEGESIPIGIVTMNTGHAAARDHGRIVSAAEATAWYDTTGNAAAFVNIGEDKFGIWISGVVDGDLSETDRQRLRASRPSGDWRPVKTNIGMSNELVGVLAVTSPGFPVVDVLVASGEVQVMTGLPAPWRPMPEDITDPTARKAFAALLAELRHLEDRVDVAEAPQVIRASAERIAAMRVVTVADGIEDGIEEGRPLVTSALERVLSRRAG